VPGDELKLAPLRVLVDLRSDQRVLREWLDALGPFPCRSPPRPHAVRRSERASDPWARGLRTTSTMRRRPAVR